MLKRILVLVIVGILVLGTVVGCSQAEYPEGVENKEFYNDMVKCVKLADKALENKNKKYTDEMTELIFKHTSDDYYEMVLGTKPLSEEAKNDFGLTTKEIDILITMSLFIGNIERYIDQYHSDGTMKSDVKIDKDDFYGNLLYKDFQEIVSIMELDYEIKLK